MKKYFIPGLTEHAKDYKWLPKDIDFIDIDWNVLDLKNIKVAKDDIVIGFSMGAVIAVVLSSKKKVNTVILCSPSEMSDINPIKTDQLIIIVGEKEEWCLKNAKRIYRAYKGKKKFIVVPDADHRISGLYRQTLLDVLEKVS